MQHNKLLLKEIQSCPSYYSGNNRKSNIWLQTEPYLTWLDAWQSSEAPWQGCFALSCPVCLLLTLWPGILLKLLLHMDWGGEIGAAVDINSGKKWKGESSRKTREPQYQFYAWASSWYQATETHYLCPITHSSIYTKKCMHADAQHPQTRPFLPTTPRFFFTLSDTHMLRSSMVGSDTKLMPCHTGCQQISQWITPQPLDVHRAKGHKHGSKRVEEEESEAECEAGNEKA